MKGPGKCSIQRFCRTFSHPGGYLRCLHAAAAQQQATLNYIWSWRTMIYLKKKIPLQLSSYGEQQQISTEPCHCTPLSPLHMGSSREIQQEEDPLVLAAPELNTRLRTHLQDLQSHIDTLSIILLHVSQVEPPPIVPPSLLPPKRQHYHVSDGFLDQL